MSAAKKLMSLFMAAILGQAASAAPQSFGLRTRIKGKAKTAGSKMARKAAAGRLTLRHP
jgi:hypothetical protein